MPHKRPISNSPERDLPGYSSVERLNGHLKDVEAAMNRLGSAIAKYYRQNDTQRRNFASIDVLFREQAKSLRVEIRRKARQSFRGGH
jgi:hypothetical protein